MKYKHAKTVSELQNESDDYIKLQKERTYLQIKEWNVSDVDADNEALGLSGSPTKVKQIENIILQAKESKKFTSDDRDIDNLIKELVENHTIG